MPFDVHGFRTEQESDSRSVFIGLGMEPAAKRFREALKEAITKV